MFEGIAILDLTAGTLLGLGVLMLLFGKILPRYIYTEKKEEADRWRLAYEQERDARQLATAQNEELLEVSKTTYSFITGVFANSERIRKADETHATTET